MRNRRWLLLTVILLGTALFGCSVPAVRKSPIPERPPVHDRLLALVEAAVERYGVRESSSAQVPGFPYLRTNRFLVAMKDRLIRPDQQEHWLDWMRRLDQQARHKEIRNLPDAALVMLSEQVSDRLDRESLENRTAESAAAIFDHDRSSPVFLEKLIAAVRIPDEYSTAMRTFGLYPVAAVPVFTVTGLVYRRFGEVHRRAPELLEVTGNLIQFAPANQADFSAETVAELFRSANRDAFGLPELNGKEVDWLFSVFAPVITQDVGADYDRFGEVGWKAGRVSVEITKPAVYTYISHGFIGGRPVLQLNYALWYAARAGPKPPVYERGPLDGLTVRVTLDTKGRALVVDIMNSCGCYHFYVPDRRRLTATRPATLGLYPFVPAGLPERFPLERLHLRVNSGWHQVEHVSSTAGPGNAQAYRMLPYDLLESLPQADGQRESVFDPNGIMKDSWRIEPYIFFSMGIPKVGYMRQRGHHAVKLVGRAHFTDPEIFDRYFVFN